MTVPTNQPASTGPAASILLHPWPSCSRSNVTKRVLVDPDDRDRVLGAEPKLMLTNEGAPKAPSVTVARRDGGPQWMFLSNWLLGLPRGERAVEHVNGDVFDCQRANLIDPTAKPSR
jgi:hypothetical protein